MSLQATDLYRIKWVSHPHPEDPQGGCSVNGNCDYQSPAVSSSRPFHGPSPLPGVFWDQNGECQLQLRGWASLSSPEREGLCPSALHTDPEILPTLYRLQSQPCGTS